MSTYWFGVGGRTDAVYVQSFDGKWGKYDNLDQIDALNVALNVKGEREAALKHSLAKRADMIEDAFERIRKSAPTRRERERSITRFAIGTRGKRKIGCASDASKNCSTLRG